MAVLSVQHNFAQEPINTQLPTVIPPSPEAQSFARYGTIPVGHETGVPNISIPLYELKAGKLSLPITLSYHAAGVKVRDIASVAGLGWTLNAGGMISRSINGRMDEASNVYSNYKTADQLQAARYAAQTDLAKELLIDELNKFNNGSYETESDRYAYNFNGHAGVFRYDVNGSMHLVPYAPLKIEKKYLNNVTSAQNLYYQVTDEDGTVYEFKAKESSLQAGSGGVSGWCVTKITSADGTDEMNFYYSSGESILTWSQHSVANAGNEYTVNGYDIYTGNPIIIGPHYHFDYYTASTGTTAYPQRLDSITTAGTRVRFEYLADRTDGRQMRINKLKVYSRINNTLIREVRFDQSYFGSSVQHTQRMKLDAVHINPGTGSNQAEDYSFVYNEQVTAPGYYYTPGYNYTSGNSTPEYLSEDYWGYYNGGAARIPIEFANNLSSGEKALCTGNMNPNSYLTQAYILKEIHYPTGGRTEFLFESNRTANTSFYGYPGQTNANGGIVGGLRISKITNYSQGNTIAFTKSYAYGNVAAEQTLPIWMFKYQQQHYYHWWVPQGETYVGTTVKDVYSSTSILPLSILDSSPVVYGMVTEYEGTASDNNGKTIYYYQVPTNSTLSGSTIQSAPRFLSAYFHDRGNLQARLLKKEVYRRNETSPVHIEENEYSVLKQDTQFATGLKVEQFMTFHCMNGAKADTDPLWHRDVYMASFNYEDTKCFEDVTMLSLSKVTDNSNPAAPVITTTTYHYENEEHLQVTKKTVSNSTGGKKVYRYKYPVDFSSSAPYSTMYSARHMWTPLIEEITSYDATGSGSETPLSGVRSDYAVFNGNERQIYPSIISTKKTSEVYQPRVQYHSYDLTGNVQEVSKYGDARITYLWGYNGLYPIAKIENATYSAVLSALGTTTAAINTMTEAPSNIRTLLPNAMVTTFTYKPLVGVETITDPKEDKITYTYDGQGRLIKVTDKTGNILSENSYNFRPN
ncbi:hypothetical protein GCM10009120_07770 [Sphingobacterium siyangense subsp. cladoniae]